jgi:hypothetical protein
MTYEISKQIRIHNTEDDWDFVFTTDEYRTVEVRSHEGLEAFSGKNTSIHIPRDCIQHFIDALTDLQTPK